MDIRSLFKNKERERAEQYKKANDALVTAMQLIMSPAQQGCADWLVEKLLEKNIVLKKSETLATKADVAYLKRIWEL